jgi:uncharacterized SAM-binding protein YcdF (DUF218 family)
MLVSYSLHSMGQEIDIHTLIQEEFRTFLTSKEYPVDKDTDGVIILSADSTDTVNTEDQARIEFGISVIKKIVSSQTGCGLESITNEDIIQHAPPLIINAETGQLPVFKEFVKRLGYPDNKIVLLDCGRQGEANTKTQFTAISKDPVLGKLHNLTIITSDYHAPRVTRTANVHLNPDTNFTVIPVPHDQYGDYSVYSKVRGEVKRIVYYTNKGDISTSTSR